MRHLALTAPCCRRLSPRSQPRGHHHCRNRRGRSPSRRGRQPQNGGIDRRGRSKPDRWPSTSCGRIRLCGSSQRSARSSSASAISAALTARFSSIAKYSGALSSEPTSRPMLSPTPATSADLSAASNPKRRPRVLGLSWLVSGEPAVPFLSGSASVTARARCCRSGIADRPVPTGVNTFPRRSPGTALALRVGDSQMRLPIMT